MSKMRRILLGMMLILAAAIILGCFGSAKTEQFLEQDTEAILPDGEHRITLPAGMTSLMPDPEESDLKGIFIREPDLEMLVYAYDAQGSTIEGLAKALREAGREAEIRRIGEESFLVYRDRDEADGAPCIGYGYPYEGWLIEISFFYSSNEAGEMTRTIMESFHG